MKPPRSADSRPEIVREEQAPAAPTDLGIAAHDHLDWLQEVPASVAASGEAVIDVERVGVCGTDVESSFRTTRGEILDRHSVGCRW
jgi:hypothetical protein